jgi:hypothetical protein
MKNSLLICLLSLFATVAFAEIDNPMILPVGETEAYMGNAGAAIRGSPGNIFYNPAGLSQLTGRRFSGSGSAYAIVKGRVHAGDEKVDFDTFASVPNMVASTRRFKDFTFGFGIFVPVTMRGLIENTSPVTSPAAGENRLSADFTTDEQFIGFALGKELKNGWSAGVTLFGHRYVNQNTVNSFLTLPTIPAYVSQHSHLELEVLSIFPVVGLQKVSGDWVFGLRVAAPSVELMGRGKMKRETLTFAGGATTEIIDEEYDGNYRSPTDVILGASWTDRRNVVTLNSGVQFPIDFETMPHSVESDLWDTKLTFRQHIGYEYKMKDDLSILAGIQRSPSTVQSRVDRSGNISRQNHYYGMTAGVFNREEKTTSGIGLFYAVARQEEKVFAFDADKSEGFQIYGVLLSTSIDY